MPAATSKCSFARRTFVISWPGVLVAANAGIYNAGHGLRAPWRRVTTSVTAPGLPAEVQCLLWQGDENGCGAIRDRELCLRSVDGRPWREWKGYKVYGQPCAWCDGENCTADDDKLCMPADWVKDQPRITVANCSRPSDSKVSWHMLQAEAAGDVELQDAGHPDFACGAPHTGSSSEADNFFYTFTAGSVDQCKQLCSSKRYCHGMEYQVRDSLCLLWWHAIQSMEPKPGHTCILARGSNTSGFVLAVNGLFEAASTSTATSASQTSTSAPMVLAGDAREAAPAEEAPEGAPPQEALRVDDPGEALPNLSAPDLRDTLTTAANSTLKPSSASWGCAGWAGNANVHCARGVGDKASPEAA